MPHIYHCITNLVAEVWIHSNKHILIIIHFWLGFWPAELKVGARGFVSFFLTHSCILIAGCAVVIKDGHTMLLHLQFVRLDHLSTPSSPAFLKMTLNPHGRSQRYFRLITDWCYCSLSMWPVTRQLWGVFRLFCVTDSSRLAKPSVSGLCAADAMSSSSQQTDASSTRSVNSPELLLFPLTLTQGCGQEYKI